MQQDATLPHVDLGYLTPEQAEQRMKGYTPVHSNGEGSLSVIRRLMAFTASRA
jgi:hypothetical protein